MNWPDRRICDLFDIEHPIIQAPMAGATTPAMAAAAGNAGALGSLGCAFAGADQVTDDVRAVRRTSNRSLNLNFFVHRRPRIDAAKNRRARARLAPWYERFGVKSEPQPAETNFPFDQAMCDAVLAASPRVASFHFGLPDDGLIKRLKEAGIVVISSATSAAETRWLEEKGADAVIAQGYEAGGHNGWFLARDGADVGRHAGPGSTRC